MNVKTHHFRFSRLVGLALLLLLPMTAYGQHGSDYVSWTLSTEPAATPPGQTVRAVLQATIAKGWKMYALDSPAGLPLSVNFEDVPSGLHLGQIKQEEPTGGYDPNFQDTIRYFEDEARLRADIDISSEAGAGPRELQGTVTFMICTDEMCLPPATKLLTASLRVKERKY